MESKETDEFCFRHDSFTREYLFPAEQFKGKQSLIDRRNNIQRTSSHLQQTSIAQTRSKHGKHCAKKSRYKEEKYIFAASLICGQEDKANINKCSLIFLLSSEFPCTLPIFLFYMHYHQTCFSYDYTPTLYL